MSLTRVRTTIRAVGASTIIKFLFSPDFHWQISLSHSTLSATLSRSDFHPSHESNVFVWPHKNLTFTPALLVDKGARNRALILSSSSDTRTTGLLQINWICCAPSRSFKNYLHFSLHCTCSESMHGPGWLTFFIAVTIAPHIQIQWGGGGSTWYHPTLSTADHSSISSL